MRRITFIFIFTSSKNIAKLCLAKLIFGVEFSPLYTFRDCRTLKNKKFTLEVAILETHDHIVGLCEGGIKANINVLCSWLSTVVWGFTALVFCRDISHGIFVRLKI